MPALAWLLSAALVSASAPADDDWDGYGAWAFPSDDGRLRLTIAVEDGRPLWRLEAVERDGSDEIRSELRRGALEAPPVDAAVLSDGRVVLFERYGGEGRGALLVVLGVDGGVDLLLDHSAVFGDAWDELRARRPWWRDFWVDELRGEVVLVDAGSRLWSVDLSSAAVERLDPPPDFDVPLGWGHWTQRLSSMERALDAGWDGPARFAPAVLVTDAHPLLWRLDAAECCARLGLVLPEIREVFEAGVASPRSVERGETWAELAPAMGPELIPECVARLVGTSDDREVDAILEGLVRTGCEAAPDLVEALLDEGLDGTAEARLARALWCVQPAEGPATLPTDGAWIARVRALRERMVREPGTAVERSSAELADLDPAALLLLTTWAARRPPAGPAARVAFEAAAARLAEASDPPPDERTFAWLGLLEDRLARALAAAGAGGD